MNSRSLLALASYQQCLICDRLVTRSKEGGTCQQCGRTDVEIVGGFPR